MSWEMSMDGGSWSRTRERALARVRYGNTFMASALWGTGWGGHALFALHTWGTENGRYLYILDGHMRRDSLLRKQQVFI